MFKLYKQFSWKDWIGVAIIIGLTFLQVYLTMTIVDYIQGIIKAITYVNYHNNPGEIYSELADLVDLMGWDGVKAISGTFGEFSSIIVEVADASTKDIWHNGLMMVGLSFALMFVQGIVSLTASYVCANLSTNIRTKLYNKVSTYSMAEINGFSTASLITRATNDIQHVQIANIMMLRMIFAAPITAVWAIIKIKASSTELTIATAIAIAVLLVFIIALMIIAIPKFKVIQKYTDALNGVTRENLTGIRIVRAFNAEKYQEDKFNKTNENFTKTQIFVGKVMSLMSPVMMIIMNGISLAIYWIGASLINKGSIDYPTVTAFMTLSSQIIMAFVMLMMMFVLWPRASVCAKRINEALETSSTILDPENPKEFVEESTFEFKDVSFKYPGSNEYAIENISFKANKGETVAIIGATGSGKTTLVNLLPRIYDSSVGEILVDGVNVKEVKQHDLRTKIGYVPQKGYLFSGSIRDNIKLGNPNMSQEEIDQACDISCSSEFIDGKIGKFDFQISQGGKNVSGGQKQRLCIARAVALKPEILIFDDSFSALDYVTDKKVRTSLKENLKDTTKLIVAQRIGTIIDADKIIVLDEGKMVGIGTHSELLENCDIYREIALSQLSADELGIKEVR